MALIAVLVILPSVFQPHAASETQANPAAFADEASIEAYNDVPSDLHSHAVHASSSQATCEAEQAGTHHDAALDDTCCYGLCFIADCVISGGATPTVQGGDKFDTRLDGLNAFPLASLYEPPIA